MIKLFVSIASLLILSACTAVVPMDKEDWESLGQREAESGVLLSDASQLAERLDTLTVSSGDYQSYTQGFKIGQKKFCSMDSAFAYGTSGKRYVGQCKGFAKEEQVKNQISTGYEQFMFPK